MSESLREMRGNQMKVNVIDDKKSKSQFTLGFPQKSTSGWLNNLITTLFSVGSFVCIEFIQLIEKFYSLW